jgi:hypothetical protein
MAKLSYLTLTNRVLKRINRNEITDVSTVSGTDKIVTEFINEAQTYLSSIEDWYSLYKTRKFSTVTYTASTISFANADPDTIDDSASGFGSFSSSQDVLVSGSTSNNGVWTVNTAAAGTLTLQSTDALTAEAEGSSITISAVTYPVASDYSRTIDLMNTTQERLLEEEVTRNFDAYDPNEDHSSPPTHFSLVDGAYRLFPTPSANQVIRERYFAFPAALTANANTSDLPEETQNLIILYARYETLDYLQKYEEADRIRIEFRTQLKQARLANKTKLDRFRQFGKGRHYGYGYHRHPRLPASYDRRCR